MMSAAPVGYSVPGNHQEHALSDGGGGKSGAHKYGETRGAPSDTQRGSSDGLQSPPHLLRNDSSTDEQKEQEAKEAREYRNESARIRTLIAQRLDVLSTSAAEDDIVEIADL